MIAYGDAHNLLLSCMKNIDFNKIHTAMVAVGWTYAGVKGTPTVYDLKVMIHRLFDSACISAEKYETGCVSSGGFEVSVSLLGEGNVVVKFILDSAYSEEV